TSPVAEALPRSGIREVMEIASAMEGVIHLEVGEPSFNTPAHIIDAAMRAAHDGVTKYTANAGLPGIRAAVAAKSTAEWGRPVSPDQVMVMAGAVNAINVMVQALAAEGDEVLVPDPGW